MKCSHQVVNVALENYALGSAYLKVTLCNDCPQVWFDTGFPLTEEFIEHTHRDGTDIYGRPPPPVYRSGNRDAGERG